MSVPTVLIIGRPNVGKSTFFNRLNKKKKSIVCDFPGVTRDLIFSYCNWQDHNYILIDSAGIFFDNSKNNNIDIFQESIEAKVKEIIPSADIILFMVDAKEGLVPYDRVIARYLIQQDKKVFLVINKSDYKALEYESTVFFGIGFSKHYFISATQNLGIETLLEDIFKSLDPSKQGFNQVDHQDMISISIVGKPNVGKSSILNALTGSDIALVSDVPGTTRDSLDHIVTYNKQPFLFVDTAGLKRNIKKANQIDFYSYVRTIRSIHDSKISLLVIDATEEITDQDKKIATLIEEHNNRIIIVVNKWDLIKKDSYTVDSFTKYVYDRLSFIDYAPLIYTSAVTRKRLHTLFDEINEVYSQSLRKFSKKELNDFVKHFAESSRNSFIKSGRVKLRYMTQDPEYLTEFSLFVSSKDIFKEQLVRHFVRSFRDQYPLKGNPIRITVKQLERIKVKS
ncbi:MAG: ribosome biogenesis GTPase Der [Candidatus Margulisbacteria bacterium GWF2_35_9]|nr:MAG: ribosome biogenesis GTPase Der [Candidatus Margulisbacteria bacterium GWF2_35_9]